MINPATCTVEKNFLIENIDGYVQILELVDYLFLKERKKYIYFACYITLYSITLQKKI